MENSNKSNAIYTKDIDDIILPESYSIKSLFTNGLDEEFGLIEKIKDRAFLNEKNSLVFIFSKFENIEKKNQNF